MKVRDFFGNLSLSIFMLFLALIPFWLYLLTRWLLGPIGFWQELALFGLWVLVLGWVQILFGVGALKFIADIWE